MITGEKECSDCKKVFEWCYLEMRLNRVYKIPEGKAKAISFTKLAEKDKYEVKVHCLNCDYLNTFEVEN